MKAYTFTFDVVDSRGEAVHEVSPGFRSAVASLIKGALQEADPGLFRWTYVETVLGTAKRGAIFSAWKKAPYEHLRFLAAHGIFRRGFSFCVDVEGHELFYGRDSAGTVHVYGVPVKVRFVGLKPVVDAVWSALEKQRATDAVRGTEYAAVPHGDPRPVICRDPLEGTQEFWVFLRDVAVPSDVRGRDRATAYVESQARRYGVSARVGFMSSARVEVQVFHGEMVRSLVVNRIGLTVTGPRENVEYLIACGLGQRPAVGFGTCISASLLVPQMA